MHIQMYICMYEFTCVSMFNYICKYESMFLNRMLLINGSPLFPKFLYFYNSLIYRILEYHISWILYFQFAYFQKFWKYTMRDMYVCYVTEFYCHNEIPLFPDFSKFHKYGWQIWIFMTDILQYRHMHRGCLCDCLHHVLFDCHFSSVFPMSETALCECTLFPACHSTLCDNSFFLFLSLPWLKWIVFYFLVCLIILPAFSFWYNVMLLILEEDSTNCH